MPVHVILFAVTGTDADHTALLATLAAILGSLVAVITLLVRNAKDTKIAAKNAVAANNAVNNIGPGEHSLWDQVGFMREDLRKLVEAQESFAEKGWNKLPIDLADAPALTQTIRDLQNRGQALTKDVGEIKTTVKELDELIREHDKWERAQKYTTENLERPIYGD